MRNKYKLENFQRRWVLKNKFVLSKGLNSSANFLSNDFQFPEEISRDFYRKPEKGELKNTMKGTITEPQRQPFLLGLLLTYVLGPWFTGLYLGSQKYWALSNPPSHLPRWWLVKWWRATANGGAAVSPPSTRPQLAATVSLVSADYPSIR